MQSWSCTTHCYLSSRRSSDVSKVMKMCVSFARMLRGPTRGLVHRVIVMMTILRTSLTGVFVHTCVFWGGWVCFPCVGQVNS